MSAAGGPAESSGSVTEPRTPPRYVYALLTAVALLAIVSLLGDSAAVPGLGQVTPLPPWDFALGPPSWLVTALTVTAYCVGAFGVIMGLRTTSGPAPRTLVTGGIIAAFALTLVPPQGSADHLSYLAYGRISQAGDDPYVVPPIVWREGADPVAGAVQPPWQHVPSVYGPVAVQAFRLAAVLGHGSLRGSVWVWSMLCALAFAVIAISINMALSGAPLAQRRAAVLWAANPLLLGQLVLGAHVDVLAVALATTGLLLALRVPLIAGALLGAAAATKAPYALFAVAALISVWRGMGPQTRYRAIAYGFFGAALVVGPAYAWAGPHALDQSRVASGFTSIASPWRWIVNVVELIPGVSMRAVVLPLALLVAALVARRIWLRISRPGRAGEERRQPPIAVRAAFALTAAWVICAPYVLPWYDAMVWVPLALAAGLPAWHPQLMRSTQHPPARDLAELFTVRLAVLSVAYLPGRVVELSPAVESATLGFRRYVAPLVMFAAAVAVWQWAGSARVTAEHGPGGDGQQERDADS